MMTGLGALFLNSIEGLAGIFCSISDVPGTHLLNLFLTVESIKSGLEMINIRMSFRGQNRGKWKRGVFQLFWA